MSQYLIRYPSDFPSGYGVVSIGSGAEQTLLPVYLAPDGNVHLVGIISEPGPGTAVRSVVGYASHQEARAACEADQQHFRRVWGLTPRERETW